MVAKQFKLLDETWLDQTDVVRDIASDDLVYHFLSLSATWNDIRKYKYSLALYKNIIKLCGAHNPHLTVY